jgi:hypothetical protein
LQSWKTALSPIALQFKGDEPSLFGSSSCQSLLIPSHQFTAMRGKRGGDASATRADDQIKSAPETLCEAIENSLIEFVP